MNHVKNIWEGCGDDRPIVKKNIQVCIVKGIKGPLEEGLPRQQSHVRPEPKRESNDLLSVRPWKETGKGPILGRK